MLIFDHPRSGVVCNFARVCLSVCLFVCQTINLESIEDVHICTSGISPWNTGKVRIWKSLGQGQGHRSKNGRKYIFPQCKTSIDHNSGSITDRATTFARSMEVSAMADRMVWRPSLSRDGKWPRVTKYTHSRVVGLRLEGNLVFFILTIGLTCWPTDRPSNHIGPKLLFSSLVGSNTDLWPIHSLLKLDIFNCTHIFYPPFCRVCAHVLCSSLDSAQECGLECRMWNMECRRGIAMRKRSVGLFVRPSVKRVNCPDFYTKRKII